MKIEFIKKRDGSLQKFIPEKIERAIYRALEASGRDDTKLAKKLAREVIGKISVQIPEVEYIQDIVEKVLMENGYPEVARLYIVYREKRKQIRESKKILGVEDRLKLSVNATHILKKRYLLKNEKGEIIETPEKMFERVAKSVAESEREYGESSEKYAEKFYQIMSSLKFLPNSPTLMNAGTSIGQLSACFVLPVEDSIKGIFETLKNMALIHQSGGGTGFSFTRLRPKGDIVGSTKGVASGPVSFMEIFDKATDIVKQGGKRRGANMGILRIDHPDIYDFITSKRKNILTNFNISVAVPDDFFTRVKKKERISLINPRNGEIIKKVSADELFTLICVNAWETGDPGIIYIDEINRHNPTPQLGEIEATNPCGEEPLLPYESCNLGSINLTKFVKNGEIDWNELKETVEISVRFLDDVIDINKFPLKKIETMTKGNRKIGLGIMGWADMLFELGIPYGSEESYKLASGLMKFINETAFKYSVYLGKIKGSFPAFEKSIYRGKVPYLRNATRTTIAPTGTISLIANCSSGIEPAFAIAYIRKILGGNEIIQINPVFEKKSKEMEFLSPDILKEIIKNGSLQKIKGIPKNIKNVFLTAFDLLPETHLKMQAVFQKHTDNAVSKTVNLPEDSTIEDIKKIFLMGYKLKCKGVTVFRYGSKTSQVLYKGETFSDNIAFLDELFTCTNGACDY